MLQETGIGIKLRTYINRLADMGLKLDSSGIWLAGGAIRRAVCGHDIEAGDFDVYVTNDWCFEKMADAHHWTQGTTAKKPNLNMVSYDFIVDSLRVQLHYVKKKPSLTAILKTFDFTCCQFGCDGSIIRYIPPALEDARNLILRYTGVLGQFTTARAFRFIEMGFKPKKECLRELQKVASTVVVANTGGMWDMAKTPGIS
jgi:hypothetical protein